MTELEIQKKSVRELSRWTEKAVKRCKECNYCHPFKDWGGCQYLACSVCADKWIVEVDICPMGTKG